MLPDSNLFDSAPSDKKRRGPYSTPDKVRRSLRETKVHRATNGCLEWQGKRNKDGYGVVVLNGREWLAHRASYFLETGTDPGPLKVLHRCDNPPCVDPAHLLLGTQHDNMKDCAAKGRTNREKTNYGEAHHDAKLTWEKVREIRRRHALGGESCAKLGVEFGVDRTNVHLIVTNRTWKES